MDARERCLTPSLPTAVSASNSVRRMARSPKKTISLAPVAVDHQGVGADSDLRAIDLQGAAADSDLQAIGLQGAVEDSDLRAIDLRGAAIALATARLQQPQKHIRRLAICNSQAVQSALLDDFLWTAHVTVKASHRRWHGIMCRRERSPSSSVFGIQRPIRKSRTGCFITFRHPRRACHRMYAGLELPG